MAFNLNDYNTVAERIAEFRDKYPNGSLQPLNHDRPFEVVKIGDKNFIICVEAAYREPDDARPGVGIAWEPIPGATPYTRDSELMNAQTGAWGRAIVGVLAADTKKGIATREDVENRQSEDRLPDDVGSRRPPIAALRAAGANDPTALRVQIAAKGADQGLSVGDLGDRFEAINGGPIGQADVQQLLTFLAALDEQQEYSA